MPRKKRKTIEQYEIISIKLTGFDTIIDGSINYEVRDSRNQSGNSKIYSSGTQLELAGICNFPDEREGDLYKFTVYGSESRQSMFEDTLSDYHVRDDDGHLKYSKVRGNQKPVYDPPKGIGIIERQRMTKHWIGYCWLPPHIVSDMLTLLVNIKSVYISLHELKIGRKRWIVGLSLQTTDPDEE